MYLFLHLLYLHWYTPEVHLFCTERMSRRAVNSTQVLTVSAFLHVEVQDLGNTYLLSSSL